jgi:hypothetical protein
VGQRGSCECGGAGREPGDTEDGDRRGRAGRVVREATASGKAAWHGLEGAREEDDEG